MVIGLAPQGGPELGDVLPTQGHVDVEVVVQQDLVLPEAIREEKRLKRCASYII